MIFHVLGVIGFLILLSYGLHWPARLWDPVRRAVVRRRIARMFGPRP